MRVNTMSMLPLDGWEAEASLVLLITALLDSMGTRQHLGACLLYFIGLEGANVALMHALSEVCRPYTPQLG